MLCKTVASVSNSTTFKLAASAFDKVNSSFIGKNIVESSVETLISTASTLVKDEKLCFDKLATNFISNLVANSIFNSIGITKNTRVNEDVVESGVKLVFKTGKEGEKYLTKIFGGESQVYFKTSLGGRYKDQLADDIAYESKVGYTSLTKFTKKQILKDAELIEQGIIKGANWNFFKSDVTGKVGASKPLLEFHEQHGIEYTIYK